ncbi:MAG: gamma-glutamylcyclotransferase [Methylobacteriaceae bacterium]|nr:gamma-glutamylcyclotransferase [Methylobacteriaceae bacterium]
MPLYFAYGSNMDAAAMARRCPASRHLGAARLARHRFAILQAGYATVERDPRSTVHGVLYDLALADVAALDRYEDIARGLYRKIMQPVLRKEGRPVTALVYVGAGPSGGKPRASYMEGLIQAADSAGLPAAYLAFLSQFAAGNRTR